MTFRIKSLQIGKSWFPEQSGSGLDRMYHALTQHLPDAGVPVRGLVAGSSNLTGAASNSVASFASDTAPLYQRLWGARQAARRTLAESTIDLVAAHFALYTAPAVDLLSDVPLVVHFHGPWAQESAVEGEHAAAVRLKEAAERYVYRRGTRFIVLSKAFHDVLARDYDVPASQIRIVSGGVDVDRFAVDASAEDARERLGWSTDRPILLSVRRLAPRMGLETLVSAMQSIRDRVPDALLLIAGKGPLGPTLEQQIAAQGLDDHVRLLGFVPDDDLPYAYRAADVTVVPTEALEGFGLITIESLAAGTPVFVTPRGGLPEVVRDLDPALIFEDAEANAMADRLTEALAGQLDLPSAVACRDYTRAQYAWPVIAQQVRAVYEEVV